MREAYAAKVLQELERAGMPMSAKEIRTRAGLSERCVRYGIERLLLTGALEMTKRIDTHRRGPRPVVYSLSKK